MESFSSIIWATEYDVGLWLRWSAPVETKLSLTLSEKCPYSELFWSAFPLIWTEYGEILHISPYSFRENTDQNNSEYGHFFWRKQSLKQFYSCSNMALGLIHFGFLYGWWNRIFLCKSDYFYALLLFCWVKIEEIALYAWKHNRHNLQTYHALAS